MVKIQNLWHAIVKVWSDFRDGENTVNYLWVSQALSDLMNCGPFMVFGCAIRKAVTHAMSTTLLNIAEGIAVFGGIASVWLFNKYKKWFLENVKYLLILDLIVFWSLVFITDIDLRMFEFMSALDGTLLLGIYSECCKFYLYDLLGEYKQRYEQFTQNSNRVMKFGGLLLGIYLAGKVEIKTMLFIISLISTPGSYYSYMRYLKMKQWSNKQPS